MMLEQQLGTYLLEAYYRHRLPYQHQYSYFVLTPIDQGLLRLTLDSDWGSRAVHWLWAVPLTLMLR